MKKEFLVVTGSRVSKVKVRQLKDILKDLKDLITAFYNDEMYDSLAYTSGIYHDYESAQSRGDYKKIEKMIQEGIKNFAWCQIVGNEPIDEALYLIVDGDNLITTFMGSEVEW